MARSKSVPSISPTCCAPASRPATSRRRPRRHRPHPLRRSPHRALSPLASPLMPSSMVPPPGPLSNRNAPDGPGDRMNTPLVIIIGADKGGVGKTHVCRSLRDYMETPKLKAFPRPRLLDGQFPRGDMAQFCPGAEIINITDISDQMKVFDTLSGVTIVDIPAGLLGYTLKACDDARLLDDVRSGALRMALLHVLGPSVSSLAEIGEATAMLC